MKKDNFSTRGGRVIITEKNDYSKGVEAGTRLLAVRSHSVFEFRKKLLERGYPESIVSLVVDEFLALGYLNDRGFAGNFVRSWMRGKKYGYNFLKAKLKAQYRVGDVDSLAALDEYCSMEDELELAKQVLSKIPDKSYQSKRGALDRRGFRTGVVARALGGGAGSSDW